MKRIAELLLELQLRGISNSLLLPILIAPRNVPPIYAEWLVLIRALNSAFPDAVKLIAHTVCG